MPGLQAEWEKEMLSTAANPGKRTDWDLAWDCLLKLTEGGDGEKIIRNYHFAVGTKKWKELKLDELDRKLRELESSYPQLSQTCAIAEGETGRKSHILVRGDYKNPGVEVKPATPAFRRVGRLWVSNTNDQFLTGRYTCEGVETPSRVAVTS